MTNEVMRYSFFVSEDGHGNPYVDDHEDPGYGQWVKYEDIAPLLEELASLRAIIEPKAPKYDYEFVSKPASISVAAEPAGGCIHCGEEHE